nr:6-hydroxymethylpterin diphosphokinase MptE-like protein [Roseospira visakhapatnamensis]
MAGRVAGRRAFIVGNGPSLAAMDLAPLAGEITFAFNGAWRLRESLVPTIHMVEDRLVAEEEAAHLAALDPATLLVLPTDHADVSPPAPGRLHVPVDWSYYDPLRPPREPGFTTNAAAGRLHAGQSVAYLALQVAFVMGCDPVVLLGIDLDYRLPASARVAGPVVTSTAADPNHFDPAYFGPGRRWHLPKTDRMLVAFRRAARVYAEHGRRLVNATPGGRLTGVPRLAYTAATADRPRPARRQRQATSAQAPTA